MDAKATASGQENAEESSVTMLDVLEQEKELEEEYAAVLGGSDEKCCTYTKGAIQRQALYSCLTCCPEARTDLEKCAGICLACSYKCHENHDLIELYTKRNFRCDCPTTRLGQHRCALNAMLYDVQPANAENLYNQNFQGFYCTCHRPYPDPESTTEDVMLQCTICEDWYHLHHLDVPAQYAKLVDGYNEMICGGCMRQHSFLQSYTGLALKPVQDADDEVVNVEAAAAAAAATTDDDNKLKSDLDKSISEIMNMNNEVETAEKKQKNNNDDATDEEVNATTAAVDAPTPAGDDGGGGPGPGPGPASKKRKVNVNEVPSRKCRRPQIESSNYEKGAVFWGLDWRSELCDCAICVEMYKAEKVSYLLDAEDSAKSYEDRGIKRAASETSSYEQGIKALASIGHERQINAITGYNHMKDKLKEYLQTFAVSKKVVTEEDINRFFEEMRNEKNANLAQPYFCR